MSQSLLTEPSRRATSGTGACVERAMALVESEMHQVEARLAELLHSPVGPIPEVGAHLLNAGGKRLRPLIAILAGRAVGCPIDLSITVGCAAELIHTASLYHDDVVDDGRVRRGRPAARMVYGNGLVVLVGDFCLARALELVAETRSMIAVQTLAATVTEMTQGEVAQLERAGNPDLSIAQYFEVIDRKTAALIGWCARTGCAADAQQDHALEQYGRTMGRAFQIADDVLDCDVDELTTGKTVGRDLGEGKLTLPVLLACEADPSLRARIRAEMGERGLSETGRWAVLEATRRAGGIEQARRHAEALARDASEHLNVLPPTPFRDALRELAMYACTRVS